jgi:hypothetical protein
MDRIGKPLVLSCSSCTAKGDAFVAFPDEDEQQPSTLVTFRLNFFDELRRKAPGKN